MKIVALYSFNSCVKLCDFRAIPAALAENIVSVLFVFGLLVLLVFLVVLLGFILFFVFCWFFDIFLGFCWCFLYHYILLVPSVPLCWAEIRRKVQEPTIESPVTTVSKFAGSQMFY